MNPISFDHNLNCIVRIPAESVGISFLINPLFSKTAENLKTDISNCQDNNLKLKLERLLKDLENGKFDFITDTWNIPADDEGNTTVSNGNDVDITADDRNNGNWMVTVHNVRAEHTGFWYAALNIPNEIQNIKEHIHILEGYMAFADRIDELITTIKQSACEENILAELVSRGCSAKQAQAILGLRMNQLVQIEKERLTEEINNCNALIEILKEYT